MASSKISNRKSMKPKVPRPINCFVAFRLDKYPIIAAQSPKLNHRDISKIIAKWWKDASDEEKKPYIEIALQKKAEHKRLYPDYKYEPVKKSEKNIRPYQRKEDEAVTRRKAEASKKLIKQWLGDDYDDNSTDDNDSVNGHLSCGSSQSSGSSASSVASPSAQTVLSCDVFKDDFFPLNNDNQSTLFNPLFDFDSSYIASQAMPLDSFFIQPWMDVDPTPLNSANMPFYDYENFINPQDFSL